MTSMTLAVTDSATMLRRNLKRMVRYPSMTLLLVGMPIVFLLLFVYVFGGTLGNGLGQPSGGRSAYLAYVVPGILLMSAASTAQGTAISVAMDMTEGIVARFRTMAIARVSVLTGHVVGAVVQTLLCVAVVFGVSVAIGYRPHASALDLLGLVGVIAMVGFALTWLSVALGMVTKSVEAASNLPMPLVLLPFLSSGFVPVDSMPTALRVFAEYQPFTPIIETLRGFLAGTGVGHAGLEAVAWCAGIALVGYLWAKRLYARDPIR